ncbi:MAG: hypothetical protein A2648_01210 [Candidatus Lloydbacteria bacterium RIFCSPHIGHO2_01_FULL_41_20]|uniref:Prepilin peptidase n=1 Tax=Candidatus Lloydbacteria bacterium RIFCSPHIGHO2_01_FULL_41_20 TaxID=1798657 RepID=A0A1G2CSH8_9BACT|nr:MAG: hypothetical protein A2648_01210 [Candidatus Lloydbacteria bacterium RIFCSPHIGHO2_01_FULL_41_20]
MFLSLPVIIKRMEYLVFLSVFVFGTIIGSFLNVVIFRYNTNFSLGGRSICLYCGKILRWYELVPLISFLVLKGRCATCRSRLSLQYPSVEFMAGTLFLFSFIYAKNNMIEAIFYFLPYLWVVMSLILVIVVYDLRHKIIPDGLVFFFILLSLLRPVIFLLPGENITLALLSGPVFALPFMALFFFSRGRWIGLGDAKLVLGIGWFLGMVSAGLALLFSFWIGAVVAIFLLLLKDRKFTMESEIPFAPFLVLGLIIALFVPTSYLLRVLGFSG